MSTSITVTVEAKKQLANGAIAIRLRANGDESSDSWATFYPQSGHHIDRETKQLIPATTEACIYAWVAAEKQRVREEYASMQLTHQTLLNAIGS